MNSEQKNFMAANAIVNLEPIFGNVVGTNFQKLHSFGGVVHIRTLYLLQRVGELTLSEIARHHNISKAYVSQLIPQMEQEGLVRRFKKGNDKKSTYISITDIGTGKLMEYVFQASELLADTISDISDEDKDQIIICCNRLKSIFDRSFRSEQPISSLNT